MKKLPKFWRVYTICIAVFVIISIIFMIVLAILLANYENSAQKDRLAKQEAEQSGTTSQAAALYKAKNDAELKSFETVSKRSDLKNANTAANESAEEYLKNNTVSTPQSLMEELCAKLTRSGIDSVSDILNLGTKYESNEHIINSINEATGTYTFRLLSDETATVTKGSYTFTADIVKEQNSAGQTVYRLSKFTPQMNTLTAHFFAPENASVTINGIECDEVPSRKRGVDEEVLQKINSPGLMEYTIEGFFSEPEITVTVDGEPYAKTEIGDDIMFMPPYYEQYNDSLRARMRTLAFKYSDFVSGLRSFNSIKEYVYPGTDYYKGLSEFDNNWYYNFVDISNKESVISNFTVWSENLVSAHIEYRQFLLNSEGNARKIIPISLDIYMVCTGSPEKESSWLLLRTD